MVWLMRIIVVLVFGAFFGIQLWALMTERYGWLLAFLALDVLVALFTKQRTPGRHPHSMDP